MPSVKVAPFHKQENGNTERLSNQSEITQDVSRFQVPKAWPQSLHPRLLSHYFVAQLPIFHFLFGGFSAQITAELGLSTGLPEPSLKSVGANDLASMDTQPLS